MKKPFCAVASSYTIDVDKPDQSMENNSADDEPCLEKPVASKINFAVQLPSDDLAWTVIKPKLGSVKKRNLHERLLKMVHIRF